MKLKYWYKDIEVTKQLWQSIYLHTYVRCYGRKKELVHNSAVQQYFVKETIHE